MPSFDIVSEVDKQELDNAINQARKELATRFDFKGIAAEILPEKDKITLTADDGPHLHGLREILIGKLSKRSVDLRLHVIGDFVQSFAVCAKFELIVMDTHPSAD